MKAIYGPVQSRRLGRSLGVNVLPLKTCTYSCVYCQLGRKTNMVAERHDFFDPNELLAELERSLTENEGVIDYVTFAGEGEPTLCKSLGWLIGETKKLTGLPIAVITNGSLLSRADVRSDLAIADLVMPSVDAGTEETFRKINRPHRAIGFDEMVGGLKTFCNEYAGEVWIEVMLVKGINDTDSELEAIRAILDTLAPTRIFINVPIRPPAEEWAVPPDEERILAARVILGGAVPITDIEHGEIASRGFESPEDAILTVIRRHPMQEDQVAQTFTSFNVENAHERMQELAESGRIVRYRYRGTTFWLPAREH